MSRKIYIGKLPLDIRAEEVQRFVENEAGVRIADIKALNGYAFLAFDNPEDAEQALRLDGRDYQGQPLIVQYAKENKPRREPPRGPPSNRRPGFPVIVSNLSRDISWQVSKNSASGTGSLWTRAGCTWSLNGPPDGLLRFIPA